jgi:hypothetical protein
VATVEYRIYLRSKRYMTKAVTIVKTPTLSFSAAAAILPLHLHHLLASPATVSRTVEILKMTGG